MGRTHNHPVQRGGGGVIPLGPLSASKERDSRPRLKGTNALEVPTGEP